MDKVWFWISIRCEEDVCVVVCGFGAVFNDISDIPAERIWEDVFGDINAGTPSCRIVYARILFDTGCMSVDGPGEFEMMKNPPDFKFPATSSSNP